MKSKTSINKIQSVSKIKSITVVNCPKPKVRYKPAKPVSGTIPDVKTKLNNLQTNLQGAPVSNAVTVLPGAYISYT